MPFHRPSCALALAALLMLPGSAQAEGTIRILEQPGISYLPLHVIRDQNLIARHGAEQGLEITTEWSQAGGGAAANDALLSGSVDVVAAGLGPLLTIWDSTKGSLDVKGIAALAEIDFALFTTDPEIRKVTDFGEGDRIAVPSVGVSVQARALQLAAAKALGDDRFQTLDALTVALPHPDATQALLSGNGTVDAHFSNAPFQQQELRAAGVHKVTSWYEILGGPATSVTLLARKSFHDDNPKTYRAFLAALDEAVRFIEANPEAAADTYLRVTGSGLDRDLVLEVLDDPGVTFTTVPANTEGFAAFLHRIGAIRHEPASWRDYFFEDIHERAGG